MIRKSLLSIFLFAGLAFQACGPVNVVNPVTPPTPDGPETPETPTPSGGNADPMVICTFNIRYANTADTYPDGSSAAWKDRSAAVKKFFDTVKPDLVGLQEIRQEQSQWFSQQLTDYGYYDVSRDNASGSTVATAKGEGVGILYRKDRFDLVLKDFFWLDPDSRTLPTKNSDDTYGAWHSACRRVTVYAELKDKKHDNAVIWFFPTHYDHKSADARQNAANLMVTRMKELCKLTDLKNSSTILFHVGDLNTTQDGGQLKSLNDNMYYARLAVQGNDQYERTYNGFKDSGGSIIDHIYYGGKGVKPVKYWVDRTNYGVPYLSDHFPVLFQWEYQ